MKAVDVLIQVNNFEKVSFVHHFIKKNLKTKFDTFRKSRKQIVVTSILPKKRNRTVCLFSANASKKWLNKKALHDIKCPLITVIRYLYFFDSTIF